MREKTFGYGYCVPGDKFVKYSVVEAARRYNRINRSPRQHKGPLTRATIEVLRCLVWDFHNARTGWCFPSYEAIAAKVGCARSTVALAVKALELAGILTWAHRLFRKGHRLLRTSNSYRFRHMNPAASENRPGTTHQEIQEVTVYEAVKYVVLDPRSPLEEALIRLGSAGNFIK